MGGGGEPEVRSQNAARSLLAANVERHPDRIAFIDSAGAHSFADIDRRAGRLAASLVAHGLAPGDRLALCLPDGVDLVCAFLGAIRAGVAPIPLNTLLTTEDYAYILADSGAAAAIVSKSFVPTWKQAKADAKWRGELWLDAPPVIPDTPAVGFHDPAPRDPAFLLYSSGSTGQPKGVVHGHGSPSHTARTFGAEVLGLREDDVVYSAAKLFFAYGLGNSLTFPLSVGARCVLESGRVTPQAVWRLLRDHGVTVFFGVPTLFAALLGDAGFPEPWDLPLRLCVSAGEPLPAEISRAWTARTGVEIVDGIGSTEMLHIFVSNRPGAITHGATGHPVPEYQARIVSEDGAEVRPGDLGELLVQGPSAALGYWNNPAKTAETFVDGWVRTGDQFYQDGEGRFVCCGRTDDMLKVSGIWVSPAEVENVLIEHDAVQEAAVIGAVDGHGLMKTKAFIVLRPGATPTADLGAELQAYAKARLAPHKYPRQIEFVSHLPRTATGKVRRHVLRETPAAL